jgi:helix-turn-helix protein
MPWKESSVMDERMRFVIRLQDGESMAWLCREYGISRKTGYKIFERYEQVRPGRADGSYAPAFSLCQPTPGAGGSGDCRREEGEAALGRT